MMYTIETEELTKRFGDLVAVDNLTLRVKEGEIFGFLGPNGAGKTTTVRMLVGILTPSSGNARVGGYDLLKETERIKEIIGYMSQHFGLYEDLTVWENLTFYARLYLKDKRKSALAANEVMERFGLDFYRDHLVRNLSGGWRQRLGLACAMVHKPKIAFLDEPTAGIDPVTRRVIWDMLYELAQGGTTLFVTTHYMEEAEHCNTIGFIWQGRLIACAQPSEVKERIMGEEVVRLRVEPFFPAFEFLKEMGEPIRDVNSYGDAIHLMVKDAKEALPVIERELNSRGFSIKELTKANPTIEDVFVYLSRKELKKG
ncbi:MAG: ABC transporter ATP-binding protein [Acidobacteria bacterium]|nr:ABC transporter ATP-binding protein [Acidobacteriota bacterium]